MTEITQGGIRKMVTQIDDTVTYRLPIGDDLIHMNPLIGGTIKLQYLGEIRCVACGRKTRKSFSQGHCFPCMRQHSVGNYWWG